MSEPRFDIENWINTRKISRFQWLMGALGVAILIADGFDIQIISYLIPQITREWRMGPSYQGTILSAGYAGTMLGYMVLAPLSPKFGLKRAVMLFLTSAGLLNLLSVTALNPPALIAFRVATGMALGGLLPSAVALTSEYFPERYRASLITIMYVGIPSGFLLAGWTAWAVVGRHGWRPAMIIAGLLPLLLAVIEAVAGSESLHFLSKHADLHTGRIFSTLKKMGHTGEGLSLAVPLSASATQHRRGSIANLFRSDRRFGTLALWAMLLLNSAVYYFILSWLPLILVRIGSTQDNAILASSLVNFAGIAAGAVTGPLMDAIGRYRVVIMLFAAGTAAAIGVGLVLSPQLAVIVPAALCLGFCVSGIQKGISALVVRFYPAELRPAGLGWALAAGQVGAIAGPFAVGQLFAIGWTPRSAFFLMSCLMAGGGVAIWSMYSRYQGSARTRIAEDRTAAN